MKVISHCSTDADSTGVVEWFEKFETVDDPLVGNIIPNYWLRPFPLQHPDGDIHLLEPDTTVYHSTNDDLETLTAYLPMQDSLLPVCKSFGIDFVGDMFSGNCYAFNDPDILVRSHMAQMELPALLASMPQMSGDDLQQRIDLLLGPPTVESLRSAVEVGVYLSSNNIKHNKKFIEWLSRFVPWTVMKPIRAIAESVLKVATRMELVEVVKDLLRTAHFKQLVRSSGKFLIRAVQGSNSELVRLLIDAGARVNLKWRGHRPLVEAKTVEIARILVEAGADVNAFGGVLSDHWDYTALCMAVLHNGVKLARYLIGAGADVNLGDLHYGNPLEIAARGKQRELVELLLEHGAQVNRVPGRLGALQQAAISGSLDCVRLLVDAGADVNAPAYHPWEPTALEAASFRGHLEMVAFLLDRGANVNAPANFDSRFPKTVLSTAVENNDVKLVELLLNVGADVNIPSFSYYGCTALEVAKSQPARPEIVNMLIAKGARDPALILGPYHKILLYDATYKGDLERVQFLINLGLQIDMEMIEYEPLDCITSNPQGKTIFHLALSNEDEAPNIELFRFLLGKVEDDNTQIKVSVLSSLLTKACARQNIKLVELLIDAGADVNGRENEVNTPLLCAVYSTQPCGDFELVRFLLCKGADVNAFHEGRAFFTTVLQVSLYEQNIAMVNLLLAHGAKLNAPLVFDGTSELAYAAQTGSIELVRELLDRGAEVNSGWGLTALQAASALHPANMDLVQLLLERGADVNAPGDTTALQAAVRSGHFQLTLHLLEAGADVNAQVREDLKIPSLVRNALGVAAYHGRLDILHLLLKAGADMHLPVEERYMRAATLARNNGHIFIAECLEEWDIEEGAQGDLADGTQSSKRQRIIEESDESD